MALTVNYQYSARSKEMSEEQLTFAALRLLSYTLASRFCEHGLFGVSMSVCSLHFKATSANGDGMA